MNRSSFLVWLLMFGAAWGLCEMIVGEWIDSARPAHGSAILSLWAIFVLAAARAFVSRPGFATAIACVAVLFRLVTASPFFCHILGILCLGVAFDAAAWLILRNGRTSLARLSLTGVATAFGSHALFALTSAYVFRNPYWVDGGWARLSEHIFVTGGIVAVGAILLLPAGFRLGISGRTLERTSPRIAFGAAAAAAALFWSIGILGGS